MRGLIASSLAVGMAMALPTVAKTQPSDIRAQRQAMLTDLLTTAALKNVVQDRISCLTGEKAKGILRARARGSQALPAVSDYCVTVLIRLARDGERSLLREAGASALSSAAALDTGFMVAYGRGGTIPAGLPNMATLRPVAERCLSLNEPDAELCYATGYAYGQRARRGETVSIR